FGPFRQQRGRSCASGAGGLTVPVCQRGASWHSRGWGISNWCTTYLCRVHFDCATLPPDLIPDPQPLRNAHQRATRRPFRNRVPSAALGRWEVGQGKAALAVPRIDEDAVGLVASVHPDHRHRPIRAIQEPVRASLRDARGIAVRDLVLPPGDLANGRPGDDGDRLIEVVIMAGKGSPWLEQSVSATDSARPKSPGEEVAEEGAPGQLVDRRRGEAYQLLWACRVGVLPIRGLEFPRYEVSARVVGGEGR